MSLTLLALLVACSSGKLGDTSSVTTTEPDPATDADTDTDTDTDTDPNAPRIQIGEGETEFLDIDEGDLVDLWHGPQGGWHIFGSVRTWNLGEIATIIYWITDDELGWEIANVEHKVLMPTGTDCDGCLEYVGMFGYVFIEDYTVGMECGQCGKSDCVPPEVLIGHPATICMSVEDTDGVMAQDCLQVLIDEDPTGIDAPCVP